MKQEFVPYELAVKLKQLGFDEPCLANLIGFSDGTKENGRYKINHQQVFYPNDYTSFDDKSEELGLTPLGICGVPLFSQAFRWFREKYEYYPHFFSKKDGTFGWCIRWYIDGLQKDTPYFSSNTYEEAELACLDKLIEIVTKQQEQ